MDALAVARPAQLLAVGKREYCGASLEIAEPTGLPRHMHPWMREILSVQSGEHGRGFASALMRQVCKEADNSFTTLILTVRPFGSGLDADALEKWYAKFHFVRIQDEPVMVARRIRKP